MHRRSVLTLLGSAAAAWPLAARAQQGKVARIGYLGQTSYYGTQKQFEAFRTGLRDLGYVEGGNLNIDFRWAEGKYERLPELAAELVRLNVDIIVTGGTPAVLAAKRATTTIPIVMTVAGDAVASGIVASLNRPGGNVTGSNFYAPELNAKRLELIKDAVPRSTQIAYLMNPDNSSNAVHLQTMEPVAAALQVKIYPYVVRGLNEFEPAFMAMVRDGVDAVTMQEDTIITSNINMIGELTLKIRLPSIGGRELAEVGGLIGYGADLPALFRRAATFVDKILKGAKPSDLPVEQATRFEFILNLKTAKAVGIEVPTSILLRADEVIE